MTIVSASKFLYYERFAGAWMELFWPPARDANLVTQTSVAAYFWTATICGGYAFFTIIILNNVLLCICTICVNICSDQKRSRTAGQLVSVSLLSVTLTKLVIIRTARPGVLTRLAQLTFQGSVLKVAKLWSWLFASLSWAGMKYISTTVTWRIRYNWSTHFIDIISRMLSRCRAAFFEFFITILDSLFSVATWELSGTHILREHE